MLKYKLFSLQAQAFSFWVLTVFFSLSAFISSGDGANDVSMIQVADVGVGISGQEGMQVNKLNKQTVFVFMTE